MLTQYFVTLARYNRWMNERLISVCSGLTDLERKQDRQAPFRSIHGTWQHLLLADRVWLDRFHGLHPPYTSLSEELYPDWEQYQIERSLTDAATEAFAANLSPENLAVDLNYISLVNHGPKTIPMAMAVGHFFQHQVHHRGQITTLLEQAGQEFGVTDLIGMPGA